jgi:hypothetical protein
MKYTKIINETTLVNPNIIEYITQDLFKGKSVSSACKKFIVKYGGQDALFFGKVDINQAQLEEAMFRDKAMKVIEAMKQFKKGSDDIALAAVAQKFKLNTKDTATLNVYVQKLKPDAINELVDVQEIK